MRRAWVLLPFLLPVWAQTALAPLKEHPLRLQAEAGLRAAQRSLEAQAPLLSLNLQGNYARFGYECTPESLCETLPETAQGLTVALVLTPFPFGDAEDGVRRARIALRRAELAYRRTLTALQAQAVAAYGRYQEALLAQAVAEKGLVLAQKTLEAAKARQATPREIREAELALKEAQNRLAEAQQGVALARQAAEGLVDLEASLPEIPPPQGRMPLRLEEARLGLAEAEVAYSAAQRNLLPTVQGSLSFYPNERDAVSLSLSSRTLQPTLAYTRQDPARSGALSAHGRGPTLPFPDAFPRVVRRPRRGKSPGAGRAKGPPSGKDPGTAPGSHPKECPPQRGGGLSARPVARGSRAPDPGRS